MTEIRTWVAEAAQQELEQDPVIDRREAAADVERDTEAKAAAQRAVLQDGALGPETGATGITMLDETGFIVGGELADNRLVEHAVPQARCRDKPGLGVADDHLSKAVRLVAPRHEGPVEGEDVAVGVEIEARDPRAPALAADVLAEGPPQRLGRAQALKAA